jgi:porin
MPSLIAELPDYGGDLARRKYLTGDWGGVRTELAEQGLLFDVELTQWLQGNAYGGRDTNNAFRYSGSLDYWIKLDTARMNLWPGGLITLHGETQLGESVNGKVGSLLSPNHQALLPVPGDPGLTTLSEFYLTQALSEKFVVLAGKIDVSLGDDNVFAHNQRTQFSNVAFRINPVLFSAAPYTTMAVGAIWLPADWLSIATFVNDNDPDGAAQNTGFNTAFHGRNWLSVAQEYTFKWKPFGQPGHQRFGWLWTSREFRDLESDSRLPLPITRVGGGILSRRLTPRWLRTLRLGDTVTSLTRPNERSDNWAIYYNFDQYLHTESDDPQQGWGVFGRFGLAPSDGNVFEEFYSLGLGGAGTIPGRDRDSWGLGYYLADASSDLGDLAGIESEQGVELYYNIEIAPWLHLTPDLQVIVDPAGGLGGNEPAIVYGLRLQMTF